MSKIRGRQHYLHRAVDKQGETIDFPLSEKRDVVAAYAFLEKIFKTNNIPEKIAIDGSKANKLAMEQTQEANESKIKIYETKYLNNIVEQDRRGIKGRIRPMLGFKSSSGAKAILTGIEAVRMIKKGQSGSLGKGKAVLDQFCMLAG